MKVLRAPLDLGIKPFVTELTDQYPATMALESLPAFLVLFRDPLFCCVFGAEGFCFPSSLTVSPYRLPAEALAVPGSPGSILLMPEVPYA